MDSISVFLATGFFLSLVPMALVRRLPLTGFNVEKWSGCGHVGSALGVATYLLLPLPWASSVWVLLAAILAAVVISTRAERVLGRHDDARIVVDEWIGAWIAATGVAHEWGWGALAAFALFRLFDIVKGPFGPLQRLPGGWGVTMDDVAAGAAASVVLRFLPLR